MRRRHTAKAAVLLTAALLVTACTSDDDDSAESTPTEQTTVDETTPEETTPEETTPDETTPEETAPDETTPDDGTEPSTGAGGVGEVGGSACGTPHGAYDDSVEPAGEVRVAWNDPPLTLNNDTTHGNALAVTNVLTILNGTGLSYYDADLNLINNDQFGTCTVESLEPLVLSYHVNEGVTWSDGTQIDAADLILKWASLSTHYNEDGICFLGDGTAIQCNSETQAWLVVTPDGETREELAEDYDEDGELLEGFEYVPATGVAFDGASPAMIKISEFPEISDDGLGITVTYDTFDVDYQLNAITPTVPAHITAGRALGIDDPAEAKEALITAFQDNDAESVAAIAEFWNTEFDISSLPDDEGLYLSYGPYTLASYEEVSELTFEANPNYTWGPKPHVQTIVYRIIGDPAAAVQALANEEVDIISPQATTDTVTELEGYADRGVVLVSDPQATYEHVDMAVANNGPFDPATYGGDAETALKVRQAFLLSVPRQEIIDRLIAPIAPGTEIRNSLVKQPSDPLYDEIVANNGSDFYPPEGDPAAAAALLAEAGVTTPVNVRVLFADNNPRRAAIFDLISASAAEAGFNLVDGRSATWSAELGNIQDYDANFFAWVSSSTAVGEAEANFVTGGANNFYGYSNAEVDALFAELAGESDPDRQGEIIVDAEKLLWDDAFGLPIFQHPGVTAYNENYLTGIEPFPLSPGIFHNVWDWEAVS